MRKLAVGVLAVGVCIGLVWPGTAASQSPPASEAAATPNAVSVWNANAGKAAIAGCMAPTTDPFRESRMTAMMHVAIHDALNAIQRRFRPYVPGLRGPKGASPEAAVAAAAHDVLVPLVTQGAFQNCLATSLAGVEADYAATLAAIPDGLAKTQGVAIGQTAAAQILARRSGDGSDTPYLDSAYPQGTQPGQYRYTAPFNFVVAPGWATVTPFVLSDSAQYRPVPPYLVTGKNYATDLNEVKALGADGTTTPSSRTADQTEIALFWVGTSAGQWNRITRTISATAGLDLWTSARLFALLNIAMADGVIASWDANYAYNQWRPITAIRSADTDGNPNTQVDPTWTPLFTTPPWPQYDSVHSVQAAAAGQVLIRVLGTDSFAFAACTLTLPGGNCDDPTPTVRSYTSFSQAVNEAGVSRVLVGSEFRKSVVEGLRHGSKIGNRAVDRFLKPTL